MNTTYDIDTLKRSELVELIREAKHDALTSESGDFASRGGQVLALDINGERLEGGPVSYFEGCPSLKQLKQIFIDYPDCVEVNVEGETRYYAEYGNAATQRSESTPCDWWCVRLVPGYTLVKPPVETKLSQWHKDDGLDQLRDIMNNFLNS
mgnify:CR=1 FL=1